MWSDNSTPLKIKINWRSKPQLSYRYFWKKDIHLLINDKQYTIIISNCRQ